MIMTDRQIADKIKISHMGVNLILERVFNKLFKAAQWDLGTKDKYTCFCLVYDILSEKGMNLTQEEFVKMLPKKLRIKIGNAIIEQQLQ